MSYNFLIVGGDERISMLAKELIKRWRIVCTLLQMRVEGATRGN